MILCFFGVTIGWTMWFDDEEPWSWEDFDIALNFTTG